MAGKTSWSRTSTSKWSQKGRARRASVSSAATPPGPGAQLLGRSAAWAAGRASPAGASRPRSTPSRSRKPTSAVRRGGPTAPPAASHPGVGAEAERDRDRHVGGLAGRRGLAVVEVEMAVEVDQAEGGAERVARARQRPRQLRAAAAGEEGADAVAEQLGDGAADRRRGLKHVGAGEDPGLGVALLAADPHLKVAAVLAAERPAGPARAAPPGRTRCRRRGRPSRSGRR